MDLLTNQVILLTLISFTSTAIVKWLPNSSFNIPSNFKDGKLPCSKKTVVFPQSIMGSVGLQSVLEIGSLVLPEDGEIVLENALISLGEDAKDNNCTDGNSYYLDKSVSSWIQAGVWSSSRFTEATPDSERIPCYNDIVVFPANAEYTVQLPDYVQTVRELRLNGTSYSSMTMFYRYFLMQSDSKAQFIMNSLYDFGVNIRNIQCQNRFGCPCQRYSPKIDCTTKYCPRPTCVDPIKPTGYCCSFCGGHLIIDIDEGFDMIAFKEFVDKSVEGYGSTIVYHIGLLTDPVQVSKRKIQLVIVDKGEYSGNSAEAITDINKNLQSHWYKGEKLSQISGSPLSKRYLGAKFFVSAFFVVIIVLGAVYIYYYRPPGVTFPVGLRQARSPGNFFRFQTRSESVVSLTRRDSAAIPLPRMAFRNPLYDSKRGRVQVEETAEVEESAVEES